MRHTILKRGLKGALIIGGLCTLIPSVYGQGIGLKKLDEMMTPTKQKLARGEVVYERQCVTCHGAKGDNDTPWARQNGLPQGGFAAGTYKYGGGLIQVYNTISKKKAGSNHPVFNYLQFQDRWAVSHYVRELSPTKPADPPAVIEQAKFEAINGVCDTEIKSSISERVKPKGAEQLAKGKELYAANCASCHGEQGAGDGAAAAALEPKPRNFTNKDAQWTNGTSPLAIFGTLANGIEGTSMASYSNLTEDERWALTHYVRNWVPESARAESTEEQINEVCRSLSAPPKPDAIPIEMAMKFIIEDAPARAALRRSQYGPVYRYPEADVMRGRALYDANCASCHGNRGDGARPNGPYGATPPFLYLQVSPLKNTSAGGSFNTFAQRSSKGAHGTLPNMTGAALLSEQDWKDLQAYVASFDGDAQFIEASAAALLNAPPKVVTLSVDGAGAVMLGEEAIELAQLGERIAQERVEGKRLEVIVETPEGIDAGLVTPIIDAIKGAGIEQVATQTASPEEAAPAESPEGDAPAPAEGADATPQ